MCNVYRSGTSPDGDVGADARAATARIAAFALGFGWPLVVLPFLAAPLQRRATGFLTTHHRPIGIASGILLISVAIFGAITELSNQA